MFDLSFKYGVQAVLQAIQGQTVPEVITLAQSRDSVKIVAAERASVDTHKQVEVN